ncbi:MAG: ABC-F family ATP-binding cassette domain-containing protein [Dissulfurispiraceae bacterium]
MIQVNALEKAYGEQLIFDNVSFSLNAGERVGLIGRNGHGKTTLFRMIVGEERPDSGTINIPKDYQIGHLSQIISFGGDSVLEEGCLALRATEDGRDETYKAKTILLGLGFSASDLEKSPRELSGGFQVRLNLARVLVAEPNLLLLDEPTNYLDILSIRWLAQFLRSWKNEMLLITHDRDFMDSVTTHTMGIHRCKLRKIAGPTQKLYDQILLEEEVYEQTRINDEKRRREVEQFINRFRVQATRARAVQSRIKALQKKEKLEKMGVINALDFKFNEVPFLGRWLIEVENLSFSFDDSKEQIISGLNVVIAKDDRIGVIGKNGKGKTTLLNLLAGELSPVGGKIVRHAQSRLAYFGQTNIDRLNPNNTVEEEIVQVQPELNRREARAVCGAMMFEGDHALKKIGVLSGGEKSRVLLGKLLVSPANFLLLDEPTNHLDMESIDSLLEAIAEFEGAVLIVTHSEMILNAIATRLIVFDEGKVAVFEGTYQDFLDRIGWKDEAEATIRDGLDMEGRNRSPKKKDIRRLRAEVIDQRSRILGSLQHRITEVEDTIMHLEQEIERDTQSLLRASERGEWQEATTLSKAMHAGKRKVDDLFGELEILTSQHLAKAREFEEDLGRLQ